MPCTILVVDDEPPIRKGVIAIINKEIPSPTIIAEASNGLEGYTLYQSLKPDLIISDIVMPKLTGLELLQRIREEDKETPVILISGYDEFSYAKQAIALHVTNYILKPISRTELVTSIASVIQEKRLASPAATVDIDALRSEAQTLFLQHLLSGNIETMEEVEDTMANLWLDVRPSSFTVLTVATRSGQEGQALANAVKALPSAQVLGSVSYQNSQVVVVNGRQAEARAVAAMVLRSDSLEPASILVGIGTTVDHLRAISSSFQQSGAALSYFPYYPDRSIFDQRDIDALPVTISTAQIDTAALKDVLLIEGDEQLKQWVADFFDLIMDRRKPPLSYIKGMCIFLLSDIQKQLVSGHHIKEIHFKDTQTLLKGHALTVEEMRWRVTETLLEIKHTVIPRSWVENDRTIHMAKRHVQQHIGSIVSAVDIAERLGMSATYFSTYFRTKTGETFSNYVNSKKNEYAKELLADFELSIEEVSQALGYTDYRSFHRVFKKMNAMTPSDYRRRIREQCSITTE